MEQDNVIDVTATNAIAKSGKKSGLIIGGATVVTLGVAYGTYKLIKHISKKKQAKKAAKADVK